MLLTVLFALSSVAEVQQPSPSPLIIDTDVGGDDLMAVAFLLQQPEIHIEAITISNGLAHVEQGARNILRLLQLSKHGDIPVFIGRSTPLRGQATFPADWRKTTDSLPGVDLPPCILNPQRQSAADFLVQRLGDSTARVRILTLGPLTNLGEVLRLAPQSADAIEEIVISGGALHVAGNLGDGGYFRTDNTVAEWNMFIDPLAAKIVFDSKASLTLMPLDASNRVQIDHQFLRTFQQSARTPLAVVVRQILEANREYIDRGIYYAWDPLAATILVSPGVAAFEYTRIKIELDQGVEGQTILLSNQPHNARVALNPKTDKFRSIFQQAFDIH